ncbi:A-kinase anchor protein 7 [Megalops cyprinoides]|uniref:A-kinase anchor protein 7 n=1 Tax=Megalops cyprinoides TaxID=118141 RepID=UPI0018650D6C|nr:A-kinase anchor protein 7 [Megalops cyprinoides]
MIPLRVLLFQTPRFTVKVARQSLPCVFHKLPGGQVNLANKVGRQSRCCAFSALPVGQANFTDMQPVSGPETDFHIVELDTSMELDSGLLELAPATNALEDVNPEDSCLLSAPCVTERIDSEHETPKKQRKKTKKARLRGRKQNAKSSDCADSLLAELPFANAEIWTDLGFTTCEKNVKKKRKRGDSGRGESEEDGEKKKKKKQPRPNYFVSIPIRNPMITEGIKAVQDLVVQNEERYSRALIPVGSLHITLLVAYLSNEEEVNMAKSVMEQTKQALQDLLEGRDLILPFCGIGHFKNEVVFAQLAEGSHVSKLTEIADAVRKAFEEKGVSPGDSKAFKPHLTFMKLSRAPKLRSQGIKKIDPKVYESLAQHSFGEETVSRIDLCSMLKKKSADGYYHCETTITLGEKKGAEPDDEELLSLSKRLVEDAVLKAVQQYMEETQQNQGPPKPGQNLNTSSGSK